LHSLKVLIEATSRLCFVLAEESEYSCFIAKTTVVILHVHNGCIAT